MFQIGESVVLELIIPYGENPIYVLDFIDHVSVSSIYVKRYRHLIFDLHTTTDTSCKARILSKDESNGHFARLQLLETIFQQILLSRADTKTILCAMKLLGIEKP